MIFIFICWLFYGINHLGISYANRSLSPFSILHTLLYGRLASSLICNIYYIIVSRDPASKDRDPASNPLVIVIDRKNIMPFFSPFISNIGWILYIKLSQSNDITYIAPICSLYTIIPILYGTIHYKESINRYKTIGILFSILSIILINIRNTSNSNTINSNTSNSFSYYTILYLFGVISIWSFGDIINISIGKNINNENRTVILFTTISYAINLLIISIALNSMNITYSYNISWLYIFLSNIIYTPGWLSLTLAYKKYEVSLVNPIISTNILISIAYGIVREKPSIYRIFGIIFAILSLISLNIKGRIRDQIIEPIKEPIREPIRDIEIETI